MPEVSEVKTLVEDVVDLTIKPAEEAEVMESATLELQQQPAAEEAEAELTVPQEEEKIGEAPRLLVMPEPQTVEQGQTVTFECQLTGEPTPEVHHSCSLSDHPSLLRFFTRGSKSTCFTNPFTLDFLFLPPD